MMEITDLTKTELLKIISNHFLRIKPRDILKVRLETVCAKAKKLCDEACAEMQTNHGPENYKKWKAANDKFDSGQKMYTEADRIFKQLSNCNRD